MDNIAIFASGGGSNALKILKHFENSDLARIKLIVTNRRNAGVLRHAEENSISWKYYPKENWNSSPMEIVQELKTQKIDYVVLAGFLLKVPDVIIDAFAEKILNIHPALLPDFGGKGMYGMHVHQAVLDSGKPETGITIHLINSKYDDGRIIFQGKVNVESVDTPESIQKKVQILEHKWFPQVIEKYIKEKAAS